MFLCWVCCVLSGRGLCDELITRPEESYRLWRVVVCDLETSTVRRPCVGPQRHGREKLKINIRPKYNTVLSGQYIHLTFDILASESYTCLFLTLFSHFVHSRSFKFKDVWSVNTKIIERDRHSRSKVSENLVNIGWGTQQNFSRYGISDNQYFSPLFPQWEIDGLTYIDICPFEEQCHLLTPCTCGHQYDWSVE